MADEKPGTESISVEDVLDDDARKRIDEAERVGGDEPDADSAADEDDRAPGRRP
jgi:hypothetical protein